jgi:DNA-binding GntR family transcriptional regulator
VEEHRAIISSLIVGDTDAAAKALEMHVLNIQQRVLEDFSLDDNANKRGRGDE